MLRLWSAVLLLIALTISACGEDNDPGAPTSEPTAAESPAPSPTATAIPEGERAGTDGFRAFAATLDAAVRRGDVAFIMDRLKTEPVVCTEQDVPPQGAGGPVCTVVGERFDGFPLAGWRSEGSIVPSPVIEEQLRDRFFGVALPRAGDEFGGGETQVYAISDTGVLGTYAALLTAMIERPRDFAGEGPLRVSVHTAWEFAGDRWQMTYMMNAYVLGEEFLRPDDVVKDYYPNWERFSAP